MAIVIVMGILIVVQTVRVIVIALVFSITGKLTIGKEVIITIQIKTIVRIIAVLVI